MGRRLYDLVAVCLLSWLLCVPLAWAGSTLGAVKERGFLRCGVQQRGMGLSNVDETGEWTGFFVDYCRAVAAATVGDATALEIQVTDSGNRFDVLGSGAIVVPPPLTQTVATPTSVRLRTPSDLCARKP